ncbi:MULTISPECIES: RagB/SusD family nutrient uptake outer membrane protein [Butyricimonas]|uniref:RagB/SusD family nutrient uptake outer membrane protein n=1 Tax=Butyricimonas TaxID=574697 RepID=UPI002081159A|nr:RagB/SusD family nutrient uptake outer membrane protein [Butyricimonas paravirosa]MBS7198646.1 RagB/SusD family nutrient uptake outer membrane protein [Bacteroidales bacterium]BDF54235.1 glycan metabolism protein RagB [Odoribacteraceae bacterium]GKH93097.1 glycan metabolism protein RagB [Odoribacteraceae bacterium]GKI00011.1 glycan metabolism protein RagB [Odoribacteraceae bacterium]GKI04531.1 glycan metabolism protein RagB [Odoribacteraceae bacterium]
MKKILGIFCITLLLGSCSSFLEEYSQDLSKVESYTDLDEVLLGEAYLPVGRIWSANSMLKVENKYFQTAHYMSDELTVFSWDDRGDINGVQDEMFGWHTWQQDVGLNAEGSSRNAEDEDWNKAYHCINICNMVIDAIDEQHAANEEQKLEKSRIKGEAHFLRALYYFTLVNMYGKPYSPENLSAPSIPIKLSPVVEDKEYTTNTVGETYNQILKDLDEADTCLINTTIKNRPYRADITAVYLLKSRTYLYMQNWKKAYEYAQKALAKNDNLLDLNTLSSGSGDVLTKSSPETIFSMGGHLLASSIYQQRRFSYGKWVACPVYTISDDLVSAFREGENDLRMQYYIMKDIIGGGWDFTGYMNAWVFKKVAGWENLGYKEVSDQFLFRTAEAYLNAAEAAAYMGEEGIARTLLKALRDKRLINSTMPTESGESLVTLIREERQCELCLEGHRWYDLRRYLVCEKYPYSKTITHYYTSFDYNGPLYTKRYMLETNDPAYTLALPKEVLDFQNNLGTNHRPTRTSTDYTPEEPDDVTPPVQE